jgi:tellurite resistance protein TehA-like permease
MSSFYVKNVPPLERALRIVIAVAGIAVALLTLSSPWNWAATASGLLFAVTGFVGYCPLCAMAGRRLDQRSS